MAANWEGLTPPYRTIVADPPWHYDGYAVAKNGRDKTRERPMTVKRFPYSSMSVEEIGALPVAALAERDAWLFLWTTNRYLGDAFGVLSRWGFTYRQTLVWHKQGNPSPFGGTVAPNHAEFLLLASRGSPTVRERINGSVIGAPRAGEHSRKPDVFADVVARTVDGPYVELFARAQRLGWDHWGYGYEVAS